MSGRTEAPLADAPENPGRRRFFRGLGANDPQKARNQVWRSVDGLSASSGDVFWCAWASDDTALVLGDEGSIFRHDGSAWARMTTPVNVPIHAVWGPSGDRLCAVGWMGAILEGDVTVEGGTGDEANWRLVQGCIVGEDGKYTATAENTPLFAVTGDGTGQLWAAGDNGTILTAPGPSGPWQAEDCGTRQNLRAISALPDRRMLAAGADGTVLLRDATGVWQALDCPVRSAFQAILPLGPDHALLAGGRYFIQASGFRGDLLRWRDGAFVPVVPDAPIPRLRALAGYRDGAVAVGDRGTLHFIQGERIQRLDSPTRHDLLGVAPLPTGEAMVVGDFGTVLTAAPDFHTSLAAPALAGGIETPVWSALPSGTDRQLWGIKQSATTGVIHACGEEGTVLRLFDGRWERLPPAGALGLHDVCDAGDGGLLAAGQLGEIHHFDGTRWREHFDLHMDVTILALWTDGAGTVFAAGDEGLILRWNGAEWSREASGTRSALYSLWGPDDRHLLAPGDFGAVLRWNGTRWDEFHAGTENFLFDVWGTGLTDIHTVGLSGTLGHFDGRRWTMTPARVRSDLLAISGDGGHLVTVGAAGTALVRDGTEWLADVTGFDGGLRGVTVGSFDGANMAAVAVGDGGTILKRELP